MDTENGASDDAGGTGTETIAPGTPAVSPTTGEAGGDAPRDVEPGAEPKALGEVVTEGDVEWSPPMVDAATGVSLDGHGLPINHRLRAETLVEQGKDEDPAGEVSAELLANTKERLDRQAVADAELAKAAEAANPPVRASMKTADLERIAERQGIDISGASNNEDRVAMIESARASGAARPANEEGR
jgi:hypothetical protein